ncbi:hypothetical protein ZWY2020_001145 [Hordeum vulgare]|nr:hypothetical protein ZWY2020_001145 [Hordeum vulgare]
MLMAEIFGSAVASESVSRIFSILSSGNSRVDGGAEDNAERLEFAVLKIHSVVAVSQDWLILHQPLLDWKARLKRVGEEGDAILRASRSRSAERQRSEGIASKETLFVRASLERRHACPSAAARTAAVIRATRRCGGSRGWRRSPTSSSGTSSLEAVRRA